MNQSSRRGAVTQALEPGNHPHWLMTLIEDHTPAAW